MLVINLTMLFHSACVHVEISLNGRICGKTMMSAANDENEISYLKIAVKFSEKWHRSDRTEWTSHVRYYESLNDLYIHNCVKIFCTNQFFSICKSVAEHLHHFHDCFIFCTNADKDNKLIYLPDCEKLKTSPSSKIEHKERERKRWRTILVRYFLTFHLAFTCLHCIKLTDARELVLHGHGVRCIVKLINSKMYNSNQQKATKIRRCDEETKTNKKKKKIRWNT